MNSYFIKTFGCQMNEHDSRKIATLLAEKGLSKASDALSADLLLFNTCTIREKAHQKAFSEIGVASKAKRKTPNKKIGVCGCVAQEVGAKLLKRFPEVDLIFGPDQIYQLPKILELLEAEKKSVVATNLINDPENYHFLDQVSSKKLNGPTAFVTIMKGCNSRCSYCIVPKVRGDEVCRPAREIVREVEALVELGIKEVTLLGQTVNSYGNRSDDPKIPSFSKLLCLIAENTQIERIRFTSPHPKDVKADLVELYASLAKLAPHIHLPLQSGSDRILRKMRRAYNRKLFIEKVNALREVCPKIGITTDIIVGFPGESRQDFERTLSLVKEVEFDNIYAFKYSPRPETEAIDFAAEELSIEQKKQRLEELFLVQREISKRKNKTYVGKLYDVLVEGPDRLNRDKVMGRTGSNKIVNFAGSEELIGSIIRVEITDALTNSLEGKVVGYEN